MVTKTKGGKGMNCLCKESCQDKVTGKNYEPNKVYEFTEERAKEVCEVENGRYFKRVSEKVEETTDEVELETMDELDNVEETTEKPKKSVKKSAK